MLGNIKTYGQIKDEVSNYIASSSTEMASRYDDWIVDIHREVENVYKFSWLIGTQLFHLEENKSKYVLPGDFKSLVNTDSVRIGEDYHCEYIEEWEFEKNYGLTRSNTGSIMQYFRINGEPVMVKIQPTSADNIKVKSTSTADTSTVFIEGTSGGVEGVTETITLNGTTEVSSANVYSYVRRVTKNAETTGIVTATVNGTRELVCLPQKVRAVRYRTLEFYPLSNSTAAGDPVYVTYHKYIPDPKDDGDVSIIPDPNVLIHGLKYRAYEYQGDPRYQVEQALYRGSFEGLIMDDKKRHAQTRKLSVLNRFDRNLAS